MIQVPVKTPKLVKRILPNLIWELPTEEKVLYLTFDDGPTPEITAWVLDILEQYKAQATFFCIGKNIDDHPQLFQRLVDAGHGIGNHTYNHLKGWKTSVDAYIKNIALAESTIMKQSNDSAVNSGKLFRPPYGRIKPKQSRLLMEQGYQIIMWSVLSLDWDIDVSPEDCLNNVIEKSSPGDIVVFHDSLKASRNLQHALPKVLKYFTEKGYVFRRIPELNQ